MIQSSMAQMREQDIFYGNFGTFELAYSEQKLKNSEVEEDAFSSVRWKNRQRAFLDSSQIGNMPRFSTLPTFLANHKDINIILDIGGGSGWIFNLVQSRTNNKVTYWNFEKSEICEEFSKEFGNRDEVHFVDSWEPIFELNEISLIYSNSTMQYFSDDSFFKNFKKINLPKYVVFDDFIVTETKSYWTLQNYYGNYIPYCFRNLMEFNSKMLELGYTVITIEDYKQILTPGFIYGNEKMPQTIVYQLHI